MYSKIKNIFVLSIFFLSLTLLVFFLYSIYIKHFTHEGNYLGHNNLQQKPEFFGTVKIYNATNINGLAKEMKLFLKSFEINVSSTQNYDSLVVNSRLIASSNSKELAIYVAKLIDFEIGRIEISEKEENNVILVIGADYKFLKPFKN